MDLDRLRLLAAEPERTAMARESQFPSMSEQLLRQRREIDALRRGLREAIDEIQRLYDREEDRRQEAMEMRMREP